MKWNLSMAIKVIVFDFDGTLVDSNRFKHDAFFEVFPADERHAQAVRSVLADMNEQSRFVILAEVLHRLGMDPGSGLEAKVKQLAERYNGIVLDGAKNCPEMPGAEKMLGSLSQRYRLYLSSMTPDRELKEIVGFRNWSGYFEDTYGHPHQKPETVQRIMQQETAGPRQVVVVGDGNSDRQSAEANDCFFVQVTPDFSLRDLDNIIADL
jgi:phosphoglycolate phosphatase-like HAD superfamily hydrolase